MDPRPQHATFVPAPKLLDLDYAPAIPADVLARMEVVAKGAGLPLDQIELIGQDLQACEDFVYLADVAGVHAAVQTLDWLTLESLWAQRRG